MVKSPVLSPSNSRLRTTGESYERIRRVLRLSQLQHSESPTVYLRRKLFAGANQ
jgi:hypothetical protein